METGLQCLPTWPLICSSSLSHKASSTCAYRGFSTTDLVYTPHCFCAKQTCTEQGLYVGVCWSGVGSVNRAQMQ